MPLGTLDRTPPPFFRQGFSARSKLAFFSALAIFLMVADNRFQVVRPARAALATALLPVQRVLAVPVDLWHGSGDYLRSLQQAQAAERQAQERLAALAERTARAEQLAQENVRLRALLELRPAIAVRSLPAEVMYEAADPFSRKVFIDRGATHGVVPGSPVINEAGVLGQVTQVYALNAEVTLLTRITLAAAAQPDGVRHVLVLEPLALQLPPQPEAAPAAAAQRAERQLTTPARRPQAAP